MSGFLSQMDFLSFAQITGYAAFGLGVLAFAQADDRRLKLFNASQSLVYALHFHLLGNPAAAAAALVSGSRSALALKSRSPWLAAAMIAASIAVGLVFAGSGHGWLPVIASAIATVAMFLMKGVPMRLALFASTILWLINNILSGSIGGVLLEGTIAAVSAVTIFRLYRLRREGAG